MVTINSVSLSPILFPISSSSLPPSLSLPLLPFPSSPLQILVRCLSSNRRRRETDSNPQESIFRISRSIFPRSTVAPPSNVFNNSAYCMLKVAPLFKSVPDRVCGADTEIPTQQTCWNGNSIGRSVLQSFQFANNRVFLGRGKGEIFPLAAACPL